MPAEKFGAKRPEHVDKTSPASEHVDETRSASESQNRPVSSDVLRWVSEQRGVKTDFTTHHQAGDSDVIRGNLSHSAHSDASHSDETYSDTLSNLSDDSDYNTSSGRATMLEIILPKTLDKLAQGTPDRFHYTDGGKQENPEFLRRSAGENNTRKKSGLKRDLSTREGRVDSQVDEEKQERMNNKIQGWHDRNGIPMDMGE